MKKRRQRVSEDRLTINRPDKQLNGRENTEPIPNDLVIEVLSRLPIKSIARFRSISKNWASNLLDTYFTGLFLSRSLACPKLLFVAVTKNDELQIFSSPQPQNPDENLSAVANHHTSFPIHWSSSILGTVHGLICLKRVGISKEKTETVLELYNPSTGQSLPLPKVKTRRITVISFLGYDPIVKQFKLLSMTELSRGSDKSSSEHQVLTLGTEKLSWKMINSITHSCHSDGNGICINGVLYYFATVESGDGIVCFNINSEKFKFIEAANIRREKLVNYKGKLAILDSDNQAIRGAIISLKLGVLEDVEKNEWCYHTLIFPPMWKDIVAYAWLSFVGVTRTGEIVFSPIDDPKGFYLIYYNLERNTVIKVEIQGIDASLNHRVHTFLDHVEDVKLWGSV